jgi:iron complex outermembrane receptor protein
MHNPLFPRVFPAMMLASSLMLVAEVAVADIQVNANVPASSIEHAILRLAQQADVKIVFTAIQSGRVPALKGSVGFEQQVRQWVAPHGLVLVKTGERQYRIDKILNSEGENLLPISVEDNTLNPRGQRTFDDRNGVAPSQILSLGNTATDLMTAPKSVSVITEKEITKRAATNIEEVLSYTPGVQVSAYGMDPRFDQISVRGFSSTVNADYLDGLKQMNSGWLASFHTEPYALERVEVLKGPSSIEFGQMAPGGAINRTSKWANETPFHEVSAQVGLDDHYQLAMDANDQVTGQEDQYVRFVGLVRESNSNMIGINNDSVYLAPSWLWAPDDDTSVTVYAQIHRFETSASPRTADNADGTLSNFWAGDKAFDGLDQQQYQIGYQLDLALNDTWSLHQRARYGYLDTENQYVDAADSISPTTTSLSRYSVGVYEQMNTFIIDTGLSAQFDQSWLTHEVSLGMDYLWMKADIQYMTGDAPDISLSNPDYSQAIGQPTTVLSSPDKRMDQIGLYLSDRIQLDQLHISAGVRHDRASTRNTERLTGTTERQDHSATSVNLGVLYALTEEWSPYASYSTGFSVQLGQNYAGDDFSPAETEQWELGIKYKPEATNTLVTLSAYDITQSNVLTADPDHTGFQIQTGEQRSKGVELEVQWEPTEALRFKGAYTLQDVKVTKSNDGNQGKWAIGKPKHLLSVWADMDVARHMNVGLGARYMGSSFGNSDNSQKNDAYTLYDAAWGYELDNYLQGASVQINANNLTDERYIMCDSGYCYRARGRTVLATFATRW